MEAVILTKDQYEALNARFDEIKTLVERKQNDPKQFFLDNQEFLQIMNISKRTAQNWRDEGKISFSQIGGKIYYKMSDVQEMINDHYKPAFNSKKK